MLTPGDPGYDQARTVGNAMIDRRPRIIARCAGAADVAAAVRTARDGGERYRGGRVRGDRRRRRAGVLLADERLPAGDGLSPVTLSYQSAYSH
jgi:hypothetical protein